MSTPLRQVEVLVTRFSPLWNIFVKGHIRVSITSVLLEPQLFALKHSLTGEPVHVDQSFRTHSIITRVDNSLQFGPNKLLICHTQPSQANGAQTRYISEVSTVVNRDQIFRPLEVMLTGI